MPTRISPSRPRRSIAHRLLQRDRSGLLLWNLLLSIRRSIASPRDGLLSLTADPPSRYPSVAIADSTRKTGAVRAKSNCRTLAYPRSSGIGAFIRVSPTTNPVHARSLLRALTGALRLGALLLLLCGPTGYGFHLRRTHRKCRAWHLGAGASRLA